MDITPTSYADCLKEMFALGRFGIKLELDTIAGILQRMGSPEQEFKAIHIAGTNGKGSIASYLASTLKHSGVRVGLYTSPHLIKFNERFSVDGTMVSDGEIVDAYTAVKAADIGERKATFFEIATAMAFHIFAQNGVEWAVIETGMGGRLDATNVLQPALTIISNLSIEHTEYLGETLEEIAAEKAGIIKPGVPVVTGVNQDTALAIIRNKAQGYASPVYQLDRDFSASTSPGNTGNMSASLDSTRFTYRGIHCTWPDMETPLPGPHQIQNAAIALAACEVLLNGNEPANTTPVPNSNQLPNEMTEETIRKALLATAWPGRLEYILQNPTVIIDGAHNLQAAQNLGSYIGEKKRETQNSTGNPSPATTSQYTLVIGILDDKPYREMLTHLLPPADRIIFTKAKINRSLEPETLKNFAATISHAKIEIMEDVGSAVTHALETASDQDCICIAGSLYVAGEAREKIQKDFQRKI